ncbi:hypothetical protein SO802_001134 [Lithocarpus litseifolius]|uniref:F-box associated beta-propeller type 1 domain-containing protein n=1 Tax=Lithocarpus litseifolius TaxID=425828 RepID=A0AAW2DXR7_9ROSI
MSSTRKRGGRHSGKASRKIFEAIQVSEQVMAHTFPKPKFHCQTPPSFFSKKPNSSSLRNPANKEFKVLPTSHVNCPSHVDYTYEGFKFGYDHKSSDYKVDRIVSFGDDSIVGPDRPPLVEVYTLSTDSWRQINTVLDASILSDPCKFEIYLNGAYHWLAYRSEQPWPHGDTELIISFDMSDEVFQIIRMPELEDVSGMNLKTFSVLNDCLALIFYSAEETVTVKNFDIWMMYEYGVKESWIKQLVVGPALVGIERPLGFAKNGELLLVAN